MARQKKCVNDLAIFGGTPAFGEPLHVGRPNLGNRRRLKERFDRILDSRWLTNNGPFVREFEAKLEEMLGVRHCIAMCNGTVALEIAIRALDMTGEVIVPSFTFIATVHALQWQQIRPVFCDIDPATHMLDPARVEPLIGPRTTGILGVHLWGNGCAVEALAELAARRRLRLLFDAAHALGCAHAGRMIGNFGDAEVFSFHATKFVNSFEGGAIATRNDELAAKIRLMRNFGFSGFYDQVDYVGTNGKMTEICAAMGLTSLEEMRRFLGVNRRHYRLYSRELAEIPGARLMPYADESINNCQYIVVEIDEEAFGMSRDRLVEVLHRENILARRYFYPGCHRMEPYRTLMPDAAARLPATEAVARRVMVLPTGTGVRAADIRAVCGVIRFAGRHAEEISARRHARERRQP